MLESKDTTVGDLIKEIGLKLGVASYGLHCFTQRWQHLQLEHLKKNRAASEILVEQDFP